MVEIEAEMSNLGSLIVGGVLLFVLKFMFLFGCKICVQWKYISPKILHYSLCKRRIVLPKWSKLKYSPNLELLSRFSCQTGAFMCG